jgi:hypothetical protein
MLGHNFKKLLNSWSFLNKNIADSAIDVDGNHVVGVFNLIKLTVD